MRIAVIIPAYNEAGNIGRLIEETIEAVPEARLQEVIVVDDASDDGTGAEIKAMLGRHKQLRYLRHGRRAGPECRTPLSGVIAATAPIIATMDGDGQNDPADIMRLLGAARARRAASRRSSAASAKDAKPKARARPPRASPIGSATRCSTTAARTPAAGSKSIGARTI